MDAVGGVKEENNKRFLLRTSFTENHLTNSLSLIPITSQTEQRMDKWTYQ